jgi:hypothetical protein
MKFKDLLNENKTLDISNYDGLYLDLDKFTNVWYKKRVMKHGLTVKKTIKFVKLNYENLLPNPLYIEFHIYPDETEEKQKKTFIKRATQIANGLGYKYKDIKQKSIKGHIFDINYIVVFTK